MKHWRLVVTVGLATVFFATCTAFAQGSGQGKGSQSSPRLGCQERFNAMDTDKDGKVTKEEFLATSHQGCDPEQMFKSMDVNGHGYITKDEFCASKGKGKGKGRGTGKAASQ